MRNSPQTGIATHKSDGIVPAVWGHGEVERRDDAHCSHWIPAFKQGVTWSYKGDFWLVMKIPVEFRQNAPGPSVEFY